MKKFLFLIVLLFATVSMWAQKDNPGGGISIPRGNTISVKPATTITKPSTTTLSPNSPFAPKPEKRKDFNYAPIVVGEKKSEFSMYQTNDFVNRTEEFAERTKVKPRGEDSTPYKGNMDLGTIRTKSPYIILHARDFGAQDGDRVKITLNDRTLFSEIILRSDTQPIVITLSEGFNDLRIEALNQGTSGPNTGEFNVFDKDLDKLAGGEWNLVTGFYGKFLIVKE
jgi:hypothetical protein